MGLAITNVSQPYNWNQTMKEIDVENEIRKLITNNIVTAEIVLFDNKKVVDIMLLNNNKLKFIEIKYEKKSHGRLGFGQSQGKGFQPEILKNSFTYFENNLRWILKTENSDLFWFLTNSEIREYLNNGKVEKNIMEF